MLWNASAVKGYAIAASDGRIGTVSDFLFDDANWAVRWLVVDTGAWLSGRKVLLPPSALGHLNREGREFSVGLSMQQVKDSPDIATDWPVSRQMETDLYDYYGWSPYWGMGLYMGGYGYSGSSMVDLSYMEAMRRAERTADTRRKDDDPHLRSTEAVTGYHVHASDGEVGHVEDFVLDDADWSIHFPRRRYEELVAREEGSDLAPVGTRYQLERPAGEPRCRSSERRGQPGIRCIESDRWSL